jgi:hypothetical protein
MSIDLQKNINFIKLGAALLVGDIRQYNLLPALAK